MGRFKDNNEDVFQGKKIEVTLAECGGDFNKMLKKFSRKVRKEEVLKPFFGKLMYFTTKGQKRRAKKLAGIYNTKRNAEKELDDE